MRADADRNHGGGLRPPQPMDNLPDMPLFGFNEPEFSHFGPLADGAGI